MDFDRFDGVRGKPSHGLDIRKNYFGSFPEFEDKSVNRGTDVVPVYEEGKTTQRRLVTVLESKEVKDRHATIKAELGMTGTGKNLRPIGKAIQERQQAEDAVGDARYYQSQLGNEVRSWEEI